MATRRAARRLVQGLGCVAVAAVLSACNNGSTGSGNGGSGSAGSGGTKAAAKTTVAEHDAGGMAKVLVDSGGRTLYVADQEKSGKVVCTATCAAVWVPLTTPGSQPPTGPSDLSQWLSTVMRPDGKAQVTFKGQPLYTFMFDAAAGDTKGDNAHDSFAGTSFSWHAATAAGAAASASPSASKDSGGGNGPYGY